MTDTPPRRSSARNTQAPQDAQNASSSENARNAHIDHPARNAQNAQIAPILPILPILKNFGLRLARDRFLVGTSLFMIGVAVALRWALPWAQEALVAGGYLDPTPYFSLVVSYFVVVNAAVLTGTVGGFLLLETREERTLLALAVSPPPLALHLGVVGGALTLATAGLTVALAAIIGLGSGDLGVPLAGPVIAAALLGAPGGMIQALLLSAAASNKMEAFVVMKFTALLGFAPIAAFFLPEPAQYLAGLLPPYWACKLWWIAASGGDGWAWLILPGVAVQAAWLIGLGWWFRRAAWSA